MQYKRMDEERVENAIISSIEVATKALNDMDNTNIPPDLLEHLFDTVESWEGWEEYAEERDYEMYLDAVDDMAMENYYEEKFK